MGFLLDKPSTLARTESERTANLMTWANNTTQKLNTQINAMTTQNNTTTTATLKDIEKRLKAAEKLIDKMGTQIRTLQSLVDQLGGGN